MVSEQAKRGIILVTAFSFLPIFRSGLRKNLSFWEMVWNHTIFGPFPEYIPEEDYAAAFSTRIGRRSEN